VAGIHMEGKIALITGGSSGIGKATAQAFIKHGAKVIIADISVEAGEQVVKDLKQVGGEALFVRTDVSDAAAVEAMVRKTVDTFGRLDYAFNNAGIEGDSAPTGEVDWDNLDRVININLKGLMYCMRYEISAMLQTGGGAIVNTASIAGIVGFPNLAPYVASKHAVAGMTRTAAMEYGKHNIRVNAIAPGVILTPMVERSFTEEQMEGLAETKPLGRLGQPDEIADSVIYLCSDSASFITGHILVADGGYTAG
jgi:NAD(P)-dependent dehydrogenase (short-subunit alcohol dehydrogenase family)